MSKPKPVNWELIENTDNPQLYTLVNGLIQKYHSGQEGILGVNIMLMWQFNIKPDQDGHIKVASITKSTDKNRELRDHDVIIGINKGTWEIMEQHQKEATIDNLLERIAVSKDSNDNPKEDDKSRIIYRLKNPETVVSSIIQRRHNTTVLEIQEFLIEKMETAGAEKGSYIYNNLSGK